jgi:hypothetical protein
MKKRKENNDQVIISELLAATDMDGTVIDPVKVLTILSNCDYDLHPLTEMALDNESDVMRVSVVRASPDIVRVLTLAGDCVTIHIRDKRYTRT